VVSGTQPGQDAATVSQGFSANIAGAALTDSWAWTFYRQSASLVGSHDLALDFAPGTTVGGVLDNGTYFDNAGGRGYVKFSASAVGYSIRLLLRVDPSQSVTATNTWPGSNCPVVGTLVLTADAYSAQYFGTLPSVTLSTVTATANPPAGGGGSAVTHSMRTASPPFSNLTAGAGKWWADSAHPREVVGYQGAWNTDTLKPAATAWTSTALVRGAVAGTAGRTDNGPAGISIPFGTLTGAGYVRHQWDAGNDGGRWVAGLRPGNLVYVDSGQGGAFQWIGPAFQAQYSAADRHYTGLRDPLDTASVSLAFQVDSIP
jgi:hypothetical protein